jgi:group I intron endonuclease
MENICCIYIMYWDITNPYIGQTVNLKLRYRGHINALTRGDHCNSKLQSKFNEYKEIPKIEILEICTTEQLNTLEEYYIKEFNSISTGLNIISGGYSVGKGINNSASKYSEEDLIEVYHLLNDITKSLTDVSNITDIPLSTVKKISQGVQHNKWLQEKYPLIWLNIDSNRKQRFSISNCAGTLKKQYRRIRSPDGTVHIVTNTTQFANTYKLSNGNLCAVLNGKRNSVSGWVGVV